MTMIIMIILMIIDNYDDKTGEESVPLHLWFARGDIGEISQRG